MLSLRLSLALYTIYPLSEAATEQLSLTTLADIIVNVQSRARANLIPMDTYNPAIVSNFNA